MAVTRKKEYLNPSSSEIQSSKYIEVKKRVWEEERSFVNVEQIQMGKGRRGLERLKVKTF